MTDILEKLLNNLSNLVESDLTCLIKFDQNKFECSYSTSKSDLKIDLEKLVNSNAVFDFTKIEEDLENNYNFLDSQTESFNIGSNVYYVFSASRREKFFDDNKKLVVSELTKSIEQICFKIEQNQNYSLANKDFFHLFTDATEELIFVLDQFGVITFVNRFGVEDLKYSSEEIIGKHFLQIVKDEYKGNIGLAFQKIIEEKTDSIIETELLPKFGIEQNYKIKLMPVLKNGQLDKLFGLGINLSQGNIEKKRSEELLAKLTEANRLNAIERDRAKQQINVLSELNNLKNDFISNVSHELRTPLASIIGFSETVVEDQNLTAQRAREFNEVILTESKRLAQLINDVLDFSELENEQQSLQKSSVNVIKVLENSIKKFEGDCSEKEITLTSNLPESEITIFADKERISKSFNYLLSNALKFTKKSGRITVLAQEFLKEVEIVISDTGVGIAEEKLPLLFDKFNKVKRAGNNLPGAGFGLVTVKQIIDLHKGLIRVKSEVDKGTSFIIRLPKYSFN